MTASDTELDEYNKWAVLAARAADDKLGHDTIIIEVGDVLALTEQFVVTSGSTVRQVRAMVDEIEAQISAADGPKPLRTEGLDDYRWVLMDFGAFVVHVFDDETRSYYDLERLWADCDRSDWRLESVAGE